MTMQYGIAVNRVVYADGTSTVLTVDFTKDLRKLNTFQNNMPNGVRNVEAVAVDVDNHTIPVTFVRQGCRLKFTFSSPPSETITANPAILHMAFNVSAEFLFPSDE